MATLSNVQLSLAKIPNDSTKVKATVTYTLNCNNVEKLAGSVFAETIELMGDDGSVDQVRFTFPTSGGQAQYACQDIPINRSRPANVSKQVLNEDPETGSDGSEVQDEIYARVKVVYAANPPINPAAPPPATSAPKKGWWK